MESTADSHPADNAIGIADPTSINSIRQDSVAHDNENNATISNLTYEDEYDEEEQQPTDPAATSPPSDAQLATNAVTSPHKDKGAERETNNRSPKPIVFLVTATVLLLLIVVVVVGICASGKCVSSSSTRSTTGSTKQDGNNVNTTPTVQSSSNDMTQAPAATGNSRSDAIVDFINRITLSSRTIAYSSPSTTDSGSNVVGSPEERALQWLIDFDPLRLSPNTTANEVQLTQRYAILTILVQQPWWDNNGSPEEFTYNNSCLWPGVVCQEQLVGDEGQEQPFVTNVTFTSLEYDQEIGYKSMLEGFIPPDVGLLSSLVHIDMFDNLMTGSLPASIGNWNKVQFVDLSYNSITGSLPTSIGQWSLLQYFWVTENKLSGSIPSSIGNWNELREFDTASNMLSGNLPSSIGDWRNVTTVWLSFNELTGSLPTVIGQWTLMEDFSVAENQFAGQIPNVIGTWTNLQTALFDTNNFVGTVPSGICNFTDLLDVWSDCLSEVTCNCCTDCF